MRDALAGAGRPILFSMCQWGRDSVWTWGKDYGNSWRMSGDIANNWNSLASIAASAANIGQYSAPGGFNDLDMLQVGNGGLNENEERAHVGLWMIAKSPILIGTDLSKIKQSTLNLLKNKVIHSNTKYVRGLLTVFAGFDCYQPRQAGQSRSLLPAIWQASPSEW
jgi:alpha-galactosidase